MTLGKQKCFVNYAHITQNLLFVYVIKLPIIPNNRGLHCKKKIGNVLIVSQQVQIICRSLGIRIAQFVGY